MNPSETGKLNLTDWKQIAIHAGMILLALILVTLAHLVGFLDLSGVNFLGITGQQISVGVVYLIAYVIKRYFSDYTQYLPPVGAKDSKPE